MNRFTILLIPFAMFLVWYLDRLAHQEMTLAAKLTIGAISATVLVSLVLYLLTYAYILLEKARTVKAKREAAQRDASVMVITADERQQIYVREMDSRAVYRPLHLNPGQYQNGKPADPSPVELAIYQLWHSKPAQPQAAPLLLEAQTTPELLPLLDSAQRALIVGASDAGKTNLLQWIVSRRAGAIVVIDPHAAPNKWPAKVKVIGAGSNHPEIETTLDNLIELMVKRYQEISAGLVREGEHPKLTVVVDEWMSIVYQCHNAQDVIVRLLTESRKAAMSVIIGSHSERVKSLGLNGRGDLRDGFLIVRLWVESTGERKAVFDYGRGERPCLLPGKFESGNDAPVIEIEAIAEVKPSEQEQEILDLKKDGASYNEICRRVYGDEGGKQIQMVKKVLAKYQVPL